MPVVDEAGAGIRMGSTESMEDGGHCFGVAPNAEQTWLVVGIEANPAVNMTLPHWHRMWKMRGDLEDGGPLGDTTAGVGGMAGTRVVLESSP